MAKTICTFLFWLGQWSIVPSRIRTELQTVGSHLITYHHSRPKPHPDPPAKPTRRYPIGHRLGPISITAPSTLNPFRPTAPHNPTNGAVPNLSVSAASSPEAQKAPTFPLPQTPKRETASEESGRRRYGQVHPQIRPSPHPLPRRRLLREAETGGRRSSEGRCTGGEVAVMPETGEGEGGNCSECGVLGFLNLNSK